MFDRILLFLYKIKLYFFPRFFDFFSVFFLSHEKFFCNSFIWSQGCIFFIRRRKKKLFYSSNRFFQKYSENGLSQGKKIRYLWLKGSFLITNFGSKSAWFGSRIFFWLTDGWVGGCEEWWKVVFLSETKKFVLRKYSRSSSCYCLCYFWFSKMYIILL